MKRLPFLLLFVSAALFAQAVVPPPSASAPQPSKVEKAARALVAKIPKDKLYKAAGFFAPVVKKYKPVFESFERDYQTAVDKSAIIAKYAPKAEAALAEAKAMPVPQRFEKEKADYLRIADAFMATLRLLLALNS